MSIAAKIMMAGALALIAGAAEAAETGGVRVEHAAARVVVIPEARGDYQISINQGRAGLRPLEIRKDGGVTVVDGGYGAPLGIRWGWDNLNCRGSNGRQRVDVPGKGEVAVADLPVVTIRTPLDARVGASGAVFGEVGPTRSLDVSNGGCGDWKIADVRGPLHVAMAGSGDLRGQASGEAHVAISGSADVMLGPVGGALDTRTSGSGDIHVASVRGPVDTRIAGSGDVTIDGGQAGDVRVNIAGSGDFTLRGSAASADVHVAGSGDVHIDRVTGAVHKHIAGSGDVIIGR